MWSKKWERLSNHIEKFCVEIDIKIGELMTARKVLLVGHLGFRWNLTAGYNRCKYIYVGLLPLLRE